MTVTSRQASNKSNDNFQMNGYLDGEGGDMNERDKESIKLIANILGNISAIAVGVAFFEGHPQGLAVAVIFGILSIVTIRRLK